MPLAPLGEAHKLIKEAILGEFPDADQFSFRKLGRDFLEGNAYYIEFKTPSLSDDESYYYAYVGVATCKLLNDEEEVIDYVLALLDRRRNLLQRIGDFDFVDAVGAVIAILVIVPFAYFVATNAEGTAGISKEYVAIVSIVLGYYFGRGKPK